MKVNKTTTKDIAINISQFSLYAISAYAAIQQFGLIGLIPIGFLFWISIQDHD